MAQTLFYIIIIILALDFILERILSLLNLRHWSAELPYELQAYLDKDKYFVFQRYFLTRERFSFIVSLITFFSTLLVLMAGGFGWLDELVRSFTHSPIPMALLFFGILGLAVDLLSTPFEIYNTFVIEERFGFNKTTPGTFVLDKLKSWMLAAVMGGVLLSIIVYTYSVFGDWFWLFAWAILTLFMVLMNLFYSTLIVPLFNKQTPLSDGSLRTEIEKFSSAVGFKLKDIYVMDASKRSSKGNAYFSGLGSRKRIVLYDNLIEKHKEEELVAILAHEIGHYKKKHSLKSMLIGIAEAGLMLFLLNLFIDHQPLSEALGASQASFHMGVLAFGILYIPITLLLGLLTNAYSRHNEYEADRFAAENYFPGPLAEALIKLSIDNMSNFTPHPYYVFFHYSHPPLLRRINAIHDIPQGKNESV